VPYYKPEQALPTRTMSRRRCLKLVGLALGTTLSPGLVLARPRVSEKFEKLLAFQNLHTGESLKTIYWAAGAYVPEALEDINYLMRDHRANKIKPIDPQLLDLLYALCTCLEAHRSFEVVSGYRSPATNALLRRHSSGVAKNSLHMRGKAVDLRLPGKRLSTLRRAAVSLKGGGVGYYPRSHFVHIDTGRVRYW
jgi:uncharacterized protein YcbK (DUF882 family)